MMAAASGLSLRDLRVGYGNTVVLDGLSLEVAAGELLVILGPSGCGKSTLLAAICGVQPALGGAIAIGGRDVTRLEPQERDVAVVFQSLALYPTMSVERNITFGMRMRGVGRGERAARLERVARLLQLEPYLRRRPAALSGGQRQRVAIARALVREPALFLFDEPLSSLDTKLRTELRGEIKSLHRGIGTTTIYVTHDQTEAMTLATRISVMRDGRILQVDTPARVYDRPADLFVARFVGSPGMNLIPGRIAGRTAPFAVETEAGVLPLAGYAWSAAAPAPGHGVLLGLRPEDIGPASRDGGFVATLTPLLVELTGPDILVEARFGGTGITARIERGVTVAPGRPMPFAFDLRRASVFCAETGRRL